MRIHTSVVNWVHSVGINFLSEYLPENYEIRLGKNKRTRRHLHRQLPTYSSEELQS